MKVEFDIIIIGGGIAGLWTLHRLKQAGFSVCLLEKNALGSGQTIASQGIIHGGSKYALKGKMTDAAQTVARMTKVWADCFAGTGEIDLSEVSFLSEHHYLWTSGFGAGLKAFVSSKTLSSDNRVLKSAEFPGAFQTPQFKGSLCELDEVVLDVPALLTALHQKYAECMLKIDDTWQIQRDGNKIDSICHENLSLTAKQYIVTAGDGAEKLLADFDAPKMQRRPLKMVMAKRPDEHQIFAHYVGNSTLPKMTITTHPCGKDWVWYLGGAIAETGVDRTDAEQIAFAKSELQKMLPWIDHSQTEYACIDLDRAEGFNNGKRPDSFVLKESGNMLVAWPTKLTLAPALASAILNKCETLRTQGVKPVHLPVEIERAAVSQSPWEIANYVK